MICKGIFPFKLKIKSDKISLTRHFAFYLYEILSLDFFES